MRWLIVAVIGPLVAIRAPAQDMPLSQVLIEGEGWRVARRGYEEIYLLDRDLRRNDGVIHIHHSKAISSDEIHTNGAVYLGEKPNLVLRPTPVEPRARLASSYYFEVVPERKAIRVWTGIGKWTHDVTLDGFGRPSGLALSVDGSTLFSGDAAGRYVWAFRIGKNNRDPVDRSALTAGQPYGLLRTKPNEPSGVRLLEIDTEGRIYALTNLGVQILDPTGRLCGVLNNPTREPLVGMAFGGEKGDLLYVATKTAVYARRLKSHGLGFDKAK